MDLDKLDFILKERFLQIVPVKLKYYLFNATTIFDPFKADDRHNIIINNEKSLFLSRSSNVREINNLAKQGNVLINMTKNLNLVNVTNSTIQTVLKIVLPNYHTLTFNYMDLDTDLFRQLCHKNVKRLVLKKFNLKIIPLDNVGGLSSDTSTRMLLEYLLNNYHSFDKIIFEPKDWTNDYFNILNNAKYSVNAIQFNFSEKKYSLLLDDVKLVYEFLKGYRNDIRLTFHYRAENQKREAELANFKAHFEKYFVINEDKTVYPPHGVYLMLDNDYLCFKLKK